MELNSPIYHLIMAFLYILGFIGFILSIYLMIRKKKECLYKNSMIRPMENEIFYAEGRFSENSIPKEYAVAKRIELSACLHYPELLLHPNMIWEDIPVKKRSYWNDDTWLDELEDYVELLGCNYDDLFKGKTITSIIHVLFQIEKEHLWEEVEGESLIMALYSIKKIKSRKEAKTFPASGNSELSKIRYIDTKWVTQWETTSNYLGSQSIADAIMKLQKAREIRIKAINSEDSGI